MILHLSVLIFSCGIDGGVWFIGEFWISKHAFIRFRLVEMLELTVYKTITLVKQLLSFLQHFL